jgi:hypothetical protein
LNIKLFKSKQFFIRLNITITASNTHAVKEFLHPLSVLPNSSASWRKRIIYTLGARYLSKLLDLLLIESYLLSGNHEDRDERNLSVKVVECQKV